jgi:hypothetical protein
LSSLDFLPLELVGIRVPVDSRVKRATDVDGALDVAD